MQYDALVPPQKDRWLKLSERERIDLVTGYHRGQKDCPERVELHAALHVTIENQIAMGEEEVEATLARLMEDGLDRHTALHAIASVLADHLYDLMHERIPAEGANAAYAAAVGKLTAKAWRRGFDRYRGVGRNAPCPCGSGKKYKKCCLGNEG